jgi:hypothetical protein
METMMNGVESLPREAIDETLQRVALAALAYYPEVDLDEPSDALGNDVEWCLEPLAAASIDALNQLRVTVAATIADPTTHRQDLFGAMVALAPDAF